MTDPALTPSSPSDGIFSADPSAALSVVVHPSPNHGARKAVVTQVPLIDMLVLHYTGMRSAQEALERMCDPAAQVSAHYMIDEEGSILQLVPEAQRAWHAGVSQWQGSGDVNSRSIGVEIVNPGHEFGYRPFPVAQMRSVIALCQDILQRNPSIRPTGIVGHADIAPQRKEDPGEYFDWSWLAREGVGFFPREVNQSDRDEGIGDSLLTYGDLAPWLAALGYPIDGEDGVRMALIAFQRRYRQTDISGRPDQQSYHILRAVCAALGVGVTA